MTGNNSTVLGGHRVVEVIKGFRKGIVPMGICRLNGNRSPVRGSSLSQAGDAGQQGAGRTGSRSVWVRAGGRGCEQEARGLPEGHGE